MHTGPAGPGQTPEPMTAPVIAVDLDRTLIYSPSALLLPMPDAQAPRLVCVEVHQGRPLSFLTARGYALAGQLAANCVLVPTTTRTRAQYARVHLGERPPRYAIAANGGQLLVDGEPDRDWALSVRRALHGAAPAAEVFEQLRIVGKQTWVHKRRIADDLFCYLLVDRSAMPASFLEKVRGWCADVGWSVSLQGRKLYCVPAQLTKSAAAAEVARRCGQREFWAAGDSLLDAELLPAASRAWRPAHGELAEIGWSAPHVTVTRASGVLAGEEILAGMLAAVGADRPTPAGHGLVPSTAPAGAETVGACR